MARRKIGLEAGGIVVAPAWKADRRHGMCSALLATVEGSVGGSVSQREAFPPSSWCAWQWHGILMGRLAGQELL